MHQAHKPEYRSEAKEEVGHRNEKEGVADTEQSTDHLTRRGEQKKQKYYQRIF